MTDSHRTPYRPQRQLQCPGAPRKNVMFSRDERGQSPDQMIDDDFPPLGVEIPRHNNSNRVPTRPVWSGVIQRENVMTPEQPKVNIPSQGKIMVGRASQGEIMVGRASQGKIMVGRALHLPPLPCPPIRPISNKNTNTDRDLVEYDDYRDQSPFDDDDALEEEINESFPREYDDDQ